MISSLAIIFPILAATFSRAADHQIAVGGPDLLTFNPSNVIAAIGDTITFVFHEKNHTATQSSFGSPCSPLVGPDGTTAGSNAGLFGFNSGFMPVPAGTISNFPIYQIEVNVTDPLWFYCQQSVPSSHCKAGMVFAVNPPTTGNTFDAFLAAAMASNTSTTTSSAATTSATATTTSWTSPPAPVVSTVTATVTVDEASSYTTTYAVWEGETINPTPAATPAVHKIVVGGPALVFDPSNVTAALGDVITFEFHSKNHTATQALFPSPCTNVETASNGTQIGFDSGFMPVQDNATEFPTYNITVNVTTPIWGYCRQQGPPIHCQQGMVFSINAPQTGSNTFDAFQQLAEHLNQTTSNNGTSAGNSTGNGNGTGSGGNGAGHAVMSASLTLGALGAVVAVLL